MPSFAFLWHMHQPYYRDMLTKKCVQPWVRLHGIHSYYDMLKLYADFPNVQATFNFSPSLLRQLEEYVVGGLTDKFMELTLAPANELSQDQKVFILRNFFMANPEKMIMPHVRFHRLFTMRGTETNEIDFNEAIRFFSWHDYLDIQVWFNLAWFGFKAIEELPQIREMISKGHQFDEGDKTVVVEAQKEVLKRLFDLIKNPPPNIELTSSPYFHPILPLLIDTESAKRAMPDARLPPRFTGVPLAKFQVKQGLEIFKRITGKAPQGMWPPEGAVSPEIVPILAESGIKWIATDQEILKSSIEAEKIETEKIDVYQPYNVEVDGSNIAIIFRSSELSNLVSFSYGKLEPQKASDDLLSRLRATPKSASLVPIILDGENPWEHYDQGGRPFLEGVMHGLSEFQTTTVSKFLEDHPPQHKLTKLHSGSWINANFAIWIGKEQKNRAWGCIKRTLDEIGKKIWDKASTNALESLSAACGSDWFWWFDDDFESEFKPDFDKIFRMHLKNAFSFLKQDVPLFLFDPIYRYEDRPHPMVKPPAFIHPAIDGLDTSFFEWANAVRIDVGKGIGTMGATEELIEMIYFGFNTEELFLRIDHLRKDVTFSLGEDEEIVFYIHNKVNKHKLRLFFDGHRYQMQSVGDEEGYGRTPINWAVRSEFEMGLKFSDLGYKTGEVITLVVTIVRKGIEVRRYSHIKFAIPNETYEKEMWSV